MAAATQLQIYNDALLLCEERLLASTSEARKPRYLLDQVWNNGGVQACLEEGMWTFATRSTDIVYDPSIQPSWGYIHAFKQPSDYVRTCAISSDPYFNSALTRFTDEGGYFWADAAILYLKYVSDDAAYGMNLTGWSETFKAFVVAHFASKIVKSLTHNENVQAAVMTERRRARDSALGKDGMNEPPGFFSKGQLSRARNGMYSGRPSNGSGSGSGWY